MEIHTRRRTPIEDTLEMLETIRTIAIQTKWEVGTSVSALRVAAWKLVADRELNRGGRFSSQRSAQTTVQAAYTREIELNTVLQFESLVGAWLSGFRRICASI